MAAAQDTELWTVGWGFTSRCDLSCPFCYSKTIRQGSDFQHEIDLETAGRFITRNRNTIRAFNFGTGESTLSPIFPELLELCRSAIPDAGLALTTNGALAHMLDKSMERVLHQLDECDVSLDFADEDRYDRWRGITGTWHRAIEAVRLAKDAGIQTTIVMVGTRQTLAPQNLNGLLDLAGSLDVPLRINMYMPTTGDYSFTPSVDTVLSSILLLQDRCRSIATSDRLLASLMGFPIPAGKQRSCRILPGGTVSVSTYLLSPPWVTETGIGALNLSELSGSAPFRLYESAPVPESCRSCTLAGTCRGGSRVRRWLWNGSLDMPDPFCPITAGHDPDVIRPTTMAGGDWEGPNIHLDYLPTIMAVPA